jgi:hypothetical protein
VAALYKVVETSDVTDEELERLLNDWTGQGWRLDAMQFAMRESSRRPAMAFLVFVRGGDEGEGEG